MGGQQQRAAQWWDRVRNCHKPGSSVNASAMTATLMTTNAGILSATSNDEEWQAYMEGSTTSEGALRKLQRQAAQRTTEHSAVDATTAQRNATNAFSNRKKSPPVDGTNIPDGHTENGNVRLRWTADPPTLHRTLEHEVQRASRNRAEGNGRASATTMWHRALLAKATAPDGTQKVQLKPPARAAADLEIMTKELQNLQQSLAPWQLTKSPPSNSMESALTNAPRKRALARSKLPQPSKPLLERCTKAGLVMPPASETDNGGCMQDNAQEMPPLLDVPTHANLSIAHHALDPQPWLHAVTPAHTEEWCKQLDGFKT